MGDRPCRVRVGVECQRQVDVGRDAGVELDRRVESVRHGQGRAGQHAGIDVQRVGDPHVVGATAGVRVAPDVADDAGHRDHVVAVLVERDPEPVRGRLQRVDVLQLDRAAVEVVAGAGGLGAVERLGKGLAAQVAHRSIGLLDRDVEVAARQVEGDQRRGGHAPVCERDHREEGLQPVGDGLAGAHVHWRRIVRCALGDDLRGQLERAPILPGAGAPRALHKVVHQQLPDETRLGVADGFVGQVIYLFHPDGRQGGLVGIKRVPDDVGCQPIGAGGHAGEIEPDHRPVDAREQVVGQLAADGEITGNRVAAEVPQISGGEADAQRLVGSLDPLDGEPRRCEHGGHEIVLRGHRLAMPIEQHPQRAQPAVDRDSIHVGRRADRGAVQAHRACDLE